jgi:hypothetical protein
MPPYRQLLVLTLAVTLLLAACAPAAPTTAPGTSTSPPSQTAASSTATRVPTPAPTRTPPPTPTVVPTLAPSPTAAPPAVQLDCPAGEPWSGAQSGAALAVCFDPSPPKLGVPGVFTVQLTDSAGAPISDAAVSLTLAGGMAGMEGDHDEDFELDLASQGEGVYRASGSLGASDLVLTGVVIRAQRVSDTWTFNIPADALPSPYL